MFVEVVGTQSDEEIKAIEDLNAFIEQKVQDIEFIMRNDSFAMNVVKGLVGAGSFADSMPEEVAKEVKLGSH